MFKKQQNEECFVCAMISESPIFRVAKPTQKLDILQIID